MKTKPFFSLLAFGTCLTVFAAASLPSTSSAANERFEEFFQPLRTTNATLSPDGIHLAYSVRQGDKININIIEVDNPKKLKTHVELGTDDEATPLLTTNDERTPLTILWMRWMTPTRLVIMTNRVGIGNYSNLGATYNSFGGPLSSEFVGGPPGTAGAIFGIDVDGKNPRTLVRAGEIKTTTTPMLRAPTLMPSGLANSPVGGDRVGALSEAAFSASWRTLRPSVFDFAADDSNALILRCQGGDFTQFFKLNTQTAKRVELNDEFIDEGFIPLFDRQGHLRGGLPDLLYGKPPFRYMFDKPPGFKLSRWRSLDELAGNSNGPGFSVSPETQFLERAIPLGFDENPDILYFASNLGRDKYGIYALNVKTGQRTDLALEDSTYDLIGPATHPAQNINPLLFDRYQRTLAGIRYIGQQRTTRWLRPEFQAFQEELELTFPEHNVEIVEWDRAEKRFLVFVSNATNPGAYYICEPGAKKARELVRQAAWTDSQKPQRLITFAVETTEGRKINGHLVFPRTARLDKVPLVVRCVSEPWERTPVDYLPEISAITEMGFAVLEIDSRGAWGFGINQREQFKNGYEQTYIEDLVTVIDQLSKTYRINPQHVALLGEGYGGYVALRGLQLKPDRFRCATTIDAPIDLQSWLEDQYWNARSVRSELNRTYYGDRAHLDEAPLIRHAETISRPVCLLAFPGLSGTPRTFIYREASRFAAALRRQGTTVELNDIPKEFVPDATGPQPDDGAKSHVLKLDQEYAQRLPRAEAAVYRQIEYFLNAYIYDYQVKLGPLKKLPDMGE